MDTDGMSPLHTAVSVGHVNISKLLIHLGAHVHSRDVDGRYV